MVVCRQCPADLRRSSRDLPLTSCSSCPPTPHIYPMISQYFSEAQTLNTHRRLAPGTRSHPHLKVRYIWRDSVTLYLLILNDVSLMVTHACVNQRARELFHIAFIRCVAMKDKTCPVCLEHNFAMVS